MESDKPDGRPHKLMVLPSGVLKDMAGVLRVLDEQTGQWVHVEDFKGEAFPGVLKRHWSEPSDPPEGLIFAKDPGHLLP